MQPIRLNLLSPEKKTYLLQMISYQFFKNLCELILIAIILITIAILGAKYILEKHYVDLTESFASIGRQQAGVNQKIKEINNILNTLEQTQKEYTLWTKKINEITNLIPENITLNSLILSVKKKEINFSGIAKSRENLLLFKEKIEALPDTESVEIPLSQLTQKTNATFTLTAKIK